MSILIRNVDGKTLALCAAKNKREANDLYLDDAIHHALTKKFEEDFTKMGFMFKENSSFICCDSLVEVFAIVLKKGESIIQDINQCDFLWQKDFDDTTKLKNDESEKLTQFEKIEFLEDNVGFLFDVIGTSRIYSSGISFEIEMTSSEEVFKDFLDDLAKIAIQKLQETKEREKQYLLTSCLIGSEDKIKEVDKMKEARFITAWSYESSEDDSSWDLLGTVDLKDISKIIRTENE